MDTATLKDEPATGVAELAAQARGAYQQKRTKECVELTKRILLADGENQEGKALQAAVLSDIQRDLTDARELLDDSQRMADGQKYRKAAEIVLLKILYLDPAHADAKALLAQAKASARSTGGAVEEIGFTAHPEPVERKPAARSSGIGFKIPLIAAGLALMAGGAWFFSSHATGKVGQPAAPVAEAPKTAPADVAGAALPLAIPQPPPAVIESKPVDTAPALPPPPAPAPVAPPVEPPPSKVVAGREPGSLAVNSPTAADIYLGDKLLGSTPTTLQLAPGKYSLEYRHGDLRTVMTHDVKSKETTAAFVTFETTVQVNARPWAQVFVEGSTRRALGQTPLSSVRVPIGSVLTFENPNFPAKSHRVTEADTAIQMVFP